MRLSTASERKRAAELRGRGLSYGQIAYMLGRHQSTIYRWLNPEAQRRQREYVQRYRQRKPATCRRQQRAAYRRAIERGQFGRCKHCRRPLRNHAVSKTGACRECLRADTQFFWREIQVRWLCGESMAEIADALGCSFARITSAIRSMRENGWDMPYRRLDSRRLDLGAVTA